MGMALILVDIQNDYFPGGRHVLSGPEKAAECAKAALEYFRAAGLPIWHIRHESLSPSASFFLPGTPGAEIYPLVAPREGERIIVKHAPNAFLGTELSAELRGQGIDSLAVCGMMSHMCIDTTVRAASGLGFPVTLLDDACTTGDLKWAGETIPAATVHRAFMAALDGTFARVIRTEEFLNRQD